MAVDINVMVDTFDATHTVEIQTRGCEFAGYYIGGREVQDWVSAVALFYVGEGGYCCEIGNVEL